MKIIKEQTVAFTGNRDIITSTRITDRNLSNVLRTELTNKLEECYLHGKTIYLSGMAVGWDLICAEEVLNLKLKYVDVKLVAVIPFRGQEEKYINSDKQKYNMIINSADLVDIVSDGNYEMDVYHKRNDFLVAHASEFIAYHSGKMRSGTASTINKAKKAGLNVFNLFDELNDYFLISHPAKQFLQQHSYVNCFKFDKNGIILRSKNSDINIPFFQIEKIKMERGIFLLTLTTGVEYSISPFDDMINI